jgi:hypothetical protein
MAMAAANSSAVIAYLRVYSPSVFIVADQSGVSSRRGVD